jgi:hypothetical protein
MAKREADLAICAGSRVKSITNASRGLSMWRFNDFGVAGPNTTSRPAARTARPSCPSSMFQ